MPRGPPRSPGSGADRRPAIPVHAGHAYRAAPTREEILAELNADPGIKPGPAGDYVAGNQVWQAVLVLLWLIGNSDEIPLLQDEHGRFIGARDDYVRTDAEIRQVRDWAERGLRDGGDLPEPMDPEDAMRPWSWDGLNPQGGSAMAKLFRTRESEPDLGTQLIVERGPARAPWSYFLRADTMHQLYSYLEDNPGRRQERFHELSHGEGFLEILRTRVNQQGFYLMDEPDAPLSFTACPGLAALLHDLAQAGSQAVVATHSPIVAAVPGASIFELGDWGIRTAQWEELHLVSAWRGFLTDPGAYFRHLLAD